MRARHWLIGVFIAVLSVTASAPARAQGSDDELAKMVDDLRRVGKNAEALALAQHGLYLAEQQFGSEHVSVGQRARILAEVHEGAGRDGDAVPLYRRSISIFEKALGAEHPQLADPLRRLANLVWRQGQRQIAEGLQRRALAILEAAHGPDHAAVGDSLSSLGEYLRLEGRHAEAMPRYLTVLSIFVPASSLTSAAQCGLTAGSSGFGKARI